jgi:hypothetical protein
MSLGQLSSVWKPFTQPTVGSQALLGIPRLASLRADPILAPASRLEPKSEEALDLAQVHGMVEWARNEDAKGRLARRFEVPALAIAEKKQCIEEEGWILGVD